MVKTHNCLLKVNNGTDSNMTYVVDWYRQGRLGDYVSWPKEIQPGQDLKVHSCERDRSLIGCSGFVTYKMFFDTEITLAFSNPAAGKMS